MTFRSQIRTKLTLGLMFFVLTWFVANFVDMDWAQAPLAIGMLLWFLAAIRAFQRFNWFKMGTRESSLYDGLMAKSLLGNPFARWLMWVDENGDDLDTTRNGTKSVKE